MSIINRRVFIKQAGALASALVSGTAFADVFSCRGSLSSGATFIKKHTNGPLGRYLDRYFGDYTEPPVPTDLFEIRIPDFPENCEQIRALISLKKTAWLQFSVSKIEILLQQVLLSQDIYLDKNRYEWPSRKMETVGEISHVATFTFGDYIVPSFELRYRPFYDFYRYVLVADVYSHKRNTYELHYSESNIIRLP